MNLVQVRDANWRVPYTGGWCATEQALVTMADGSLKSVKDVAVGDAIYNHDATAINVVTHVFSRKALVNKIDVVGAGTTYITPEHPIFAKKYVNKARDSYKEVEMIDAGELVKGMLVELSCPTMDTKTSLTDDELKFLGFYLGDGMRSEWQKKVKYLAQFKKERKKDYLSALSVDLNLSFNEKNGYYTASLRKTSHSTLCDYLEKCGSTASGKQLPLLFTPEEYKLIIDGYLEADGHKNKSVTVSRKLAYSLTQAGAKCGYGVGLVEHKNPETAVIQGRTVKLSPYIFYLTFNKNNSAGQNHEGFFAVKSNESNYSEEYVYNIETSGDHTYILNSIGVHNCLNYVQRAFGTPWAGATATDSWNRAAEKHYGLPPTGKTVPVYFSGISGYNGDPGHIAIVLDDGTVASSTMPGTHSQGYIHPNLNHLINMYKQYNPNFKYLGWSEDLGGLTLVKEGDMPIQDTDNYYWRYGQNLAMRVRGRTLSREEFRKHLVGQTDLRAVEILSDDPEAATAQMWQDVGRTAVTDKWDKQIYSLQDALKQSNAALDAAKKEAQLVPGLKKQVSDAQKKADEALKKSSDLEVQQNATNAEAQSFITAVINSLRNLFKK